MIIFHDRNFVEIGGFQFRFVQELNPERDNTGQIKQFMPQSNYEHSSTSKLNIHGGGPFCKFSISSKWAGYSGVYALFSDEELLYIGECIDLYKRYYMGYGNISPRNCFQGGQSTNCKINAMVLDQYLNGKKVSLYFYETGEYKRVESTLLSKLNPQYNGTGFRVTRSSQPLSSDKMFKNNIQTTSHLSSERVGMATDKGTVGMNFREYWNRIISTFRGAKIELHTLPKSNAREPLWFAVYEIDGHLYVDNAKENSPSSKISCHRRLNYTEFEKMYPIYLKRKAGYAVSAEAMATSRNQVYWYAIMNHCDL